MSKTKNKFAPPTEIRGVSLADVNAQQRAEDDLKNLLESERPGADVKAFAQGIAAASVVPFALQAVPALQKTQREYLTTIEKAQLAHWMKSRGVPEARAHSAAEGVHRYLRLSSVPREGEEAVQKFLQSGYVLPGLNTPPLEFEDLRDILRMKLPEDQVDQLMSRAKKVEPSNVDAPISRMFPSASDRARVMDSARKLFRDDKVIVPGYLKRLKNNLKPSRSFLAGTAVLGTLAGLTNVRQNRKDRRKLRKLRRRAKGETA